MRRRSIHRSINNVRWNQEPLKKLEINLFRGKRLFHGGTDRRMLTELVKIYALFGFAFVSS